MTTVSINVLWLAVSALALVFVTATAALLWNGRSTRGQHSFYAEEVSVGALTTKPSSSSTAEPGHQWPKTGRDEVLADRRGTRS